MDNWDTYNVYNIYGLFYRTGGNFLVLNISTWNIFNDTDMSYMFYAAGKKALIN